VSQQPAHVVLTLTIERPSDPIKGALCGYGMTRHFDGWLGLARALEQVLADADDQGSTDADHS
jgi:hypothetical protein